jgi:hypothetical protein
MLQHVKTLLRILIKIESKIDEWLFLHNEGERCFSSLENLIPRLSILMPSKENQQNLGVLDNFENLRTLLLHRHIEAAETAIRGLHLCIFIFPIRQ